MKRILAVLFIFSGSCIIGFGGYKALGALVGIYQSNLQDPLGQPDGAEKAASERMLQGAKVGAVGVPLLLTGSILWKLRRRPSLG